MAGLSVGDSKPNFNIFLQPIIRELINIEKRGINISFNNNENERNARFFTINGTYDKPCRAAITNMISYNGYFGCIMCLQPGISNPINKRIHIYPYQEDNPDGVIRTQELYEKYLEGVKKNHRSRYVE